MDTFVTSRLSDVLTILIVLSFVAFLFWLGHRAYRAHMEARMRRAEGFNRLLDKFGSAKEFTDFLQTEQGKRFVEDPLPAPRGSTHRIIRFVQTGIVLIGLGIAFFFNAYRLRDATEIRYTSQASDCAFWGTFSVAVGLALLLTAVVSYILAQRWHLMNGNGGRSH